MWCGAALAGVVGKIYKSLFFFNNSGKYKENYIMYIWKINKHFLFQ